MFSWFKSSATSQQSTTESEELTTESEELTTESSELSTDSTSSHPVSTRSTRSKVDRRAEPRPTILPTSLEHIIKKKKVNSQVKRQAKTQRPSKTHLIQEFLKSQDLKAPVLPSDLKILPGVQIPADFDYKMTQKDDLTADTAALETEITRLKTKVDTHDPLASPPVLLSESELDILGEDLKDATTSLKDIRTRTFRLYASTDIAATQQTILDRLTNSLTPVRIQVATIKSEYETRSKSTSLVKREPIPLPKFNGDSATWAEFKDQFDAAFHNDSNLAPSVKLQNLKNLMIPDSIPAKLLSSFTITDTNYNLAYKTLVDRYNKTRELVFSYLDILVKLPVLDSQSGLQHMIDTVNITLQKIQTLGIAIDQWDLFIVHLIYRRLDRFSLNEVEKSHPANDVPSLANIIKTLAPLAASYEITHSQKSSYDKRRSNNHTADASSSHFSSFPSNSKDSHCLICYSTQHWTSGCEELKKLATIKQRTKLLKEKSLCEKCANSHPTTECRRQKKCQIHGCNEIHHPIVCPIKLAQS